MDVSRTRTGPGSGGSGSHRHHQMPNEDFADLVFSYVLPSNDSIVSPHQNLRQQYDEAIRRHQRPVNLHGIQRYEVSGTSHAQYWAQDNDTIVFDGLEHQEENIAQRDRGLSEEVIMNYLSSRCAADVGEKSDVCVVCQDALCQPNQMLRSLHCGHEYHINCITRWLQCRNFCPLCKSVALPILRQ